MQKVRKIQLRNTEKRRRSRINPEKPGTMPMKSVSFNNDDLVVNIAKSEFFQNQSMVQKERGLVRHKQTENTEKRLELRRAKVAKLSKTKVLPV